MSEPYLLPENVSAAHAAQVLEFLNAVASAEELAVAVEIPRELDVGPRVAARILARRDELGGFTSLEQVYAVPLVGPERFTELVTSLSGARPPQVFDERVDPALLTQITQRLNNLEGQLRATETIGLSALGSDGWLGQETVLLAQLRDVRGRPMVDRAVTFVTTWGRLGGRSRVRSVAGNSVTVRTDHLGLCKLQLAASLGEALTGVQEASLGAALTLLGGGSATPRDRLEALTELARRYRAPGHDDLRRAVDVYYRRYGAQESADAPMDSLARWPSVEITVLAYVTPEPGAVTAHPTTTLLSVQQRNWFYAWAWAYRQLLERESGLVASLGDVKGEERRGSAVLTDLFSRVGTFMRSEDGWVGQLVAQDFARNSLNDFVQTGLAKFPETERTALLTGVSSGAKSLAGGGKLFSALEASRSGLTAKIDSRVEADGRVAQLEDRLGQLENVAARTADLDRLEREILARAAFDAGNQLARFETEVNAAIAAKGDAAQVDALNRQVVALQRQDEAFQADLASVNTRLDTKADVRRLDTLNGQVSELQNQNRVINDSLVNVNSRLSGIDRRFVAIDTRLDGRPR